MKNPSHKILMFYGIILMSAGASQLPFVETFDASNGVAVGAIDGQNGWVLESGTADVQTGVVTNGSQALEIVTTEVRHDLSSSNSAVWISLYARITAPPASNPDVVAENTSLAFFVNTARYIVVYSNTVEVVLGAQMPLDIWTRFDIYCDYDDGYWDLAMDGVNIAAGLPLYADSWKVDSLLLGNASASSAYADQIDVADMEPTATGLPDSDADNIPDWWEQKNFNGVTAVVASNLSANTGYTYLQTYIAGLSPFSDEPFVVSQVPGGNGMNWTPFPSRLYSVYWSSNLLDGFVWQQDLPYPQSEFIDTIHTNEPAGFYRLKVQL
ncbi:MAG: hypothetical protein ABFR33_11215 [Verrucomicrobiota bacterium]